MLFILAAGDVHLFNFNGLTKKNICTLYADSFRAIEQQLIPILAEHMSVLEPVDSRIRVDPTGSSQCGASNTKISSFNKCRNLSIMQFVMLYNISD